MLSDEEKKAIEKFKNFIYTYQDVIEDEYSDYEEKESAKEYQEVSEKILNLIEKQSKEIEELKASNIMTHNKSTNTEKAKIFDVIDNSLDRYIEKKFPVTITKEELEKRWKEDIWKI